MLDRAWSESDYRRKSRRPPSPSGELSSRHDGLSAPNGPLYRPSLVMSRQPGKRGTEPIRTATLRSMQQTYGNQAVQRARGRSKAVSRQNTPLSPVTEDEALSRMRNARQQELAQLESGKGSSDQYLGEGQGLDMRLMAMDPRMKARYETERGSDEGGFFARKLKQAKETVSQGWKNLKERRLPTDNKVPGSDYATLNETTGDKAKRYATKAGQFLVKAGTDQVPILGAGKKFYGAYKEHERQKTDEAIAADEDVSQVARNVATGLAKHHQAQKIEKGVQGATKLATDAAKIATWGAAGTVAEPTAHLVRKGVGYAAKAINYGVKAGLGINGAVTGNERETRLAARLPGEAAGDEQSSTEAEEDPLVSMPDLPAHEAEDLQLPDAPKGLSQVGERPRRQAIALEETGGLVTRPRRDQVAPPPVPVLPPVHTPEMEEDEGDELQLPSLPTHAPGSGPPTGPATATMPATTTTAKPGGWIGGAPSSARGEAILGGTRADANLGKRLADLRDWDLERRLNALRDGAPPDPEVVRETARMDNWLAKGKDEAHDEGTDPADLVLPDVLTHAPGARLGGWRAATPDAARGVPAMGGARADSHLNQRLASLQDWHLQHRLERLRDGASPDPEIARETARMDNWLAKGKDEAHDEGTDPTNPVLPDAPAHEPVLPLEQRLERLREGSGHDISGEILQARLDMLRQPERPSMTDEQAEALQFPSVPARASERASEPSLEERLARLRGGAGPDPEVLAAEQQHLAARRTPVDQANEALIRLAGADHQFGSALLQHLSPAQMSLGAELYLNKDIQKPQFEVTSQTKKGRIVKKVRSEAVSEHTLKPSEVAKVARAEKARLRERQRWGASPAWSLEGERAEADARKQAEKDARKAAAKAHRRGGADITISPPAPQLPPPQDLPIPNLPDCNVLREHLINEEVRLMEG